jgi:nicotinate-nucleotide--dimethylbenzimidazole phosphoribosyltransferase
LPSTPPAWSLAPPCALSTAHLERATARQSVLTKPPGSLGRLETVAIRLAALQATDRPKVDSVAIVLFAGDHGVTAQGVSAYPSAVTVQMLHNFGAGGAAISVLARQLAATLTVADVGSCATAPIAGVLDCRIRSGTRDFSREPAMTPEEAVAALDVGRGVVLEAVGGAGLVVLGEMGIGNTTSAAALGAALLGRTAAEVAGRGTGIDDARLACKVAVIDGALSRHGLAGRRAQPLDALVAVGGYEIAALAGAMIACAQAGVPVLVDGFIVTAAALLATRINPGIQPWLLFSHASAEQGHRRLLDAMAAEPLLDLGLRLGEGSGAALTVPLLRAALALHNEMATFAEAGVTGPA